LDRFGRKEGTDDETRRERGDWINLKMWKFEDVKMAGDPNIRFGFTGKNNRYRF
jgi:hypothetical protein